MNKRLISIIIPVYKQADHIEKAVLEYINVLSEIKTVYEIILVINGSGDNSLDICNQLSNKYPQLSVLYSEQAGWGRAIKLGLKQAKGDILCYVNSARTSAQDLISVLFYAFQYPDVVVKASRKIRDNWQRRLGSLLYNLECRALFGLAYGDVNGTPKVFPRKFDQLLSLCRDDDLIDAEFNIICRKNNYPVLEVPIFCTKRKGGKSTTNYNSALKLYWGVYKMWRDLKAKNAVKSG